MPRDASRFRRRRDRAALEPPGGSGSARSWPQPVGVTWDLWPRAEGHTRAVSGTEEQDSHSGPRSATRRRVSPSPSASASWQMLNSSWARVLGGLSLAPVHQSSVSPLWTCLAVRTRTGGCRQGLSEAPLRGVWPRVDTFPEIFGIPHQELSLRCILGECVRMCSLLGPLQPQQLLGSSSETWMLST